MNIDSFPRESQRNLKSINKNELQEITKADKKTQKMKQEHSRAEDPSPSEEFDV